MRAVDLRRRNEDQEFLKRNPAGFLPAFEDGSVVMVESIAIIEYLIAKYDGNRLAPDVDDFRFPVYQQFLHLGEAGLAAYLNVVVATRFFAPESDRQNWGAKVAERMFFNRLTLVSQRLSAAPMMAGDEFSAADISVVGRPARTRRSLRAGVAGLSQPRVLAPCLQSGEREIPTASFVKPVDCQSVDATQFNRMLIGNLFLNREHVMVSGSDSGDQDVRARP